MRETPALAGTRRWLPLLVAVAAVGAVLAILPLISPGGSTTTTVTTAPPTGLSERPPFGQPLLGAVAYLGADRVLNLVDLGTGTSLGSKGVDGDRRPAAASSTSAFVGNLPAGIISGNWDSWRTLPWAGTEYADVARGHAITYSRQLDALAVAMAPLPSGANGVLIVGPAGTWEAAASSGAWDFPTWMGDDVLTRESTGDDINWWLLDGRERSPLRPVALPRDFVPIAGAPGLVMGRSGEEGVIVDLDRGETSRLTGGWSWAAEWQPGADAPILATIGGDPPALIGYNARGTFEWSWPVGDTATRFRGGVSWSPDGEFVVATGGGGLMAFTDFGGTIGTLDRSLPPPEISDAGFVVVVATPG